MSATTDRDNAIALARTDPGAALLRARRIGDTWFRCQALAWVAWLTSETIPFLKITSEAMESALTASNPYQRTAAMALPLRALIERGQEARARTAMKKALVLAGHIENPVSKADALFLLWQAAFPLGARATEELRRALVGACIAVPGWKGQHLMRDVALMLAAEDMTLAGQVVSAMREGKKRRQAERCIDEGKFMEPRPFFWRNPRGPIDL